MSDIRALTDAELDIVGGASGDLGLTPTTGIKVVEEIIVDILRILEPQRPVMNVNQYPFV
jgi:hypothetical protein